MSNFNDVFFTSQEFIQLCQKQVFLLSKSLNAMESIIYLTKFDQQQGTNLIPFLVYPPQKKTDNSLLNLPVLPEFVGQINYSSSKILPFIDTDQNTCNLENYQEKNYNLPSKYELIFPLVYEDLVIGLLVTRKKDQEWTQKEFYQVEAIAKTITLARSLEQKYQLIQENINKEVNIKNWQKNQLDDFIHQIRNPLTALKTFTKLLVKKINLKDSNYQVTENILKETNRLQNLIEDFSLNKTKIDQLNLVNLETNITHHSFLLPSGNNELHPLKIDQIIESLLITTQVICEDKNLNFSVEIKKQLPLILGQEKALVEIFNNILDNAIKYTPSGGMISLNIEEEKLINNQPMLGIKISDTGYGISANDMIHIFERKYRGSQANSKIYGTGLGLAIVKDLCDKMQGKIELFSPSLIDHDNSSLPGTTFIVWLLIA